ncbi:TonB-dependent receptor plug domain-containing protein [Candidatus Omnitrophota bacterium]
MYTSNLYLQKTTDIFGRTGLGIEYGEERITSTNLGQYNRGHKSIFTDSSKKLNSRLSVGASARMDDFDGFSEVFTGAANLRFKVSARDSLNLGIAKNIRIPSFTELYYNDPTTIGNANLSEGETVNYQGGYDFKKDGLSLGMALFFREEEDMIDWVKRSASQAKWQAENIGEAAVFGVENYLKAKVNGFLNLESNYTYIDKRLNDIGYLYKYGPNYIRHLASAILRLDLPFGTQSITLTYKKKPRRDGWFLFGLRSSYDLNRTSQVFLQVSNLFNVEYQEIEGIPAPGRWIEAGCRFAW